MLMAGAVALSLADHMNWAKVYWIMTALMSVGFITTLVCEEPAFVESTAIDWKSFLIDPFKEFIQRRGALLILVFVIVYKVGDSIASDWTNPFFIHLGFSNTEIGTVAKLVGFWATIGGGLVGGATVLRIGIPRALWIFGIFQAVSILGFAWLTLTGPSVPWLGFVMAVECFASGMGTSAYAGFLAAATDRRFTATQYALLSSLTSIPRVLGPTPTGWVIKGIGWGPFFVFCALMALPGLILLIPLRRIVMSGSEWQR
jgi:PAT family beta-lactamase induction signal transducer AmpG